MTVARFALAIGMMPYGISKLFDLQFEVSASTYAKPLGAALGTTLTWAFLGYSPAFQFLLGVCEFVPAILLLFARTRRLGAVLLFPVLFSVALINYFLDLWPSTRVISAVLLALNIFLLLYDARLYLGFLSRLLEPPEPVVNRKLRIAGKLTALLTGALALGWFAMSIHEAVATQLDPIRDFIGQRQINRSGSWIIDSMRISGATQSAVTNVSLYFDFNKQCKLEGSSDRESGWFEANATTRTFRIRQLNWGTANRLDIAGTYRVEGNEMVLNGRAGAEDAELVLHRDRWGRHK